MTLCQGDGACLLCHNNQYFLLLLAQLQLITSCVIIHSLCSLLHAPEGRACVSLVLFYIPAPHSVSHMQSA